ARLQGIDRELAERERPSGAPAPSAIPASGPAPSANGASFADELAALRRRAAPAPSFASSPAPAPVLAAPAPVSAAPPAAAPTGQVDRDGDGRTDHWITREG